MSQGRVWFTYIVAVTLGAFSPCGTRLAVTAFLAFISLEPMVTQAGHHGHHGHGHHAHGHYLHGYWHGFPHWSDHWHDGYDYPFHFHHWHDQWGDHIHHCRYESHFASERDYYQYIEFCQNHRGGWDHYRWR